MDELTKERYPWALPIREKVSGSRIPADVVHARRVVLCGTVNVDDETQETLTALERERRLVEAIRSVA